MKVIRLTLPESAVRNIREALDHHAKAMVWRVNNNNDQRAKVEAEETNRTLDMIELQLRKAQEKKAK